MHLVQLNNRHEIGMDGASHDTYALGKLKFVSDAGECFSFWRQIFGQFSD